MSIINLMPLGNQSGESWVALIDLDGEREHIKRQYTCMCV